MTDLTIEQLEKLTKVVAISQAAIAEATRLIQIHLAQSGKPTEEILANAEKANNEARAMIDSL